MATTTTAAPSFQNIGRGLKIAADANGNPIVSEGYVTLRVNVDPSRDTQASSTGAMKLSASTVGWQQFSTPAGGFKFQLNGGFKA